MRVVTDEHAGSRRAAKWGMGDMAQVLPGLGSGFNFDRVLSCHLRDPRSASNADLH